MERHFGIGIVTAIILVVIQYCLTPLMEHPYGYAILFISLFFATLLTCTSMILEKLNTLLELSAKQEAKLRSLAHKEAAGPPASDEKNPDGIV